MTLDDIKPGDEVAIVSSGWYATASRAKVVAVTATTLTTQIGARTTRWTKRGREIGNPNRHEFVEPWGERHDEMLRPEEERRERNGLLNAVEKAPLSRLTLDQLRRIKAIIEEVAT
jgi:hypothetical protein